MWRERNKITYTIKDKYSICNHEEYNYKEEYEGQMMVAHTYNSCYLAGWDTEYCG
jgi:hypothetical protein